MAKDPAQAGADFRKEGYKLNSARNTISGKQAVKEVVRKYGGTDGK